MFNWTRKWRNLETGCLFSLFSVKTITMHNTCEDFLLAAPIILDLVLLAELSNRIRFKSEEEVHWFTKQVRLYHLENAIPYNYFIK